jgi:pimeloyl-ACP methyl ester carboxylesterase
MRNRSYWKQHYVIETNAEEIERSIRLTQFRSEDKIFELIYFEKGKDAPNILISQGSGGHSYIFAELAYLMHLRGYNVFIMPKHGGQTIDKLVMRHADAHAHISNTFSGNMTVFAEGLGCYAVFYLALATGGVMKSIACLNGPAILTEYKFHKAILQGDDAVTKRRRQLFPLIRLLGKLFPWITLPIYTYLDFPEMVDKEDEENRRIEEPIVHSFDTDPEFDMRYPLSAVLSIVSTPPPKDLSALQTPTMFLVPVRGFFPPYFKQLYDRLPSIKKRLVEIDGGVFWMLSHPNQAAKIICDWFDESPYINELT